MSASLAHRATVRTLVAAFVRNEATVRESFAALDAAQKDLNAVEAACARGRASEAPRRRTRGPEW